jgi:hypothetical protein
MFGEKKNNEWNIVEIEPKVYGGYKTETRQITTREDSDKPEISEYTFNMPKWETDGARYAYRVIHFRYPLLRANGVSPIRLADTVNYEYSSGTLKSFSTGLVNAISADTFRDGIITLLVWTTFLTPTSLPGYPPPQKWSDFRKWSSSIPQRRYEESITGWRTIIPRESLKGTNNIVSIREAKSPWPMIRNGKGS